MSARSMTRADNQAWTRGERLRHGEKIHCLYGHGQAWPEKCAELCRAGDVVCHRSGSACAVGMLAMTKVPVQ